MTRFVITVIPLTILLTLGIFAIIQFAGERLGFLPTIYLLSAAWFSDAEAVILFIISLGSSVFIALVIAYLLFSRKNKCSGF